MAKKTDFAKYPECDIMRTGLFFRRIYMTVSEKMYISSKDPKDAEALKMADEFISGQDLSRKGAIHLRLLMEETLGMFRAMTGDFRSLFWIEKEDQEYRIRITAKTEMDP